MKSGLLAGDEIVEVNGKSTKGKSTGDIFDTSTQEFSHRRKEANGKTWKTDV